MLVDRKIIQITSTVSTGWGGNITLHQHWVLQLELETDPGPFTLTIIGKDFSKTVSWPKDPTNYKEQDDAE